MSEYSTDYGRMTLAQVQAAARTTANDNRSLYDTGMSVVQAANVMLAQLGSDGLGQRLGDLILAAMDVANDAGVNLDREAPAALERRKAHMRSRC